MDQWQLADRNNCTTMPLDHNYQPGTTHFMGNPKLIMGEGTLRWFLKSQMTGLTGHHDLSEINPNPTCLAPQNSGRIHLIGRLNSQLIGSYMVMTTLYTPSIPPQGLHMLFFTRKDRYHQLLLLLSLTVHLYLPQQSYFFHFPSCL